MNALETVGIDVSKLVIDVRIHSNQEHAQFENSEKGFKKMCNWVSRNSPFKKEDTLFVFEHTGLYSYSLAVFLTNQNNPFTIVPGLQIKRSLGITRGKDDKIDAMKIAKYGYRMRGEIEPYIMPSIELIKLKQLLSLRERLVKQRSGFKTSFKEQSRILAKKENVILLNTQKKMIKYLTMQVESVEKEIDKIICSNNELSKLYRLVVSVKSVGPQTALFIIVYTEGFTKFSEARKFASYCGIAPFPHVSGSSIRGRTKVSPLANKKIKSLIDLCAKNAISHNFEMKKYYEKRVEMGKSKMSTINIIRNKLIARIFAVVRRETPYVDILKYAA